MKNDIILYLKYKLFEIIQTVALKCMTDLDYCPQSVTSEIDTRI